MDGYVRSPIQKNMVKELNSLNTELNGIDLSDHHRMRAQRKLDSKAP